MEEKENKTTSPEVSHVNVETYAEDMAKVIGSDSGGLIKKIIHGEEENEEARKNLSPESKKNKLFVFFSFLFIFAGLGILAFFLMKKDTNNTVPVAPQFIPIIFSDASVSLPIDGMQKDDVIKTVVNEVNNTKTTSGELEGIYLTENKTPIGLRRFITLIKSSFVPDNQNFIQDNFMMGVVNSGVHPDMTSGKDFFMLIKTRSTADIFNPLRAWEGAMLTDVSRLFGIQITADNQYLLTKGFQDGVIQNKNARILYDNNNQIVLMYIFADDNSVIITDTLAAADEVILRLTSDQVK